MNMNDSDTTPETAKVNRKDSLPAWKVILKMIQYRPDLWLANLFAMLLLMLFVQIPGLALREFFNRSMAYSYEGEWVMRDLPSRGRKDAHSHSNVLSSWH